MPIRMPRPYAVTLTASDGAAVRHHVDMPRLFVCAWPPAEVGEQLAMLTRPVTIGVRWVAREHWHVTLRFIGEAAVDHVVADLAAAPLPRVTARAGPAIDTFGGRQVVVPVGGVDALARAVRAATSTIGEHDPRPFRGHLTLARVRRNEPTPLLGVAFDASFVIDSVDLVVSDNRRDGPVYTPVASFACTLTA
jgi:RNA 2',3'-cyclic 3'-phosphodiesterase